MSRKIGKSPGKLSTMSRNRSENLWHVWLKVSQEIFCSALHSYIIRIPYLKKNSAGKKVRIIYSRIYSMFQKLLSLFWSLTYDTSLVP